METLSPMSHLYTRLDQPPTTPSPELAQYTAAYPTTHDAQAIASAALATQLSASSNNSQTSQVHDAVVPPTLGSGSSNASQESFHTDSTSPKSVRGVVGTLQRPYTPDQRFIGIVKAETSPVSASESHIRHGAKRTASGAVKAPANEEVFVPYGQYGATTTNGHARTPSSARAAEVWVSNLLKDMSIHLLTISLDYLPTKDATCLCHAQGEPGLGESLVGSTGTYPPIIHAHNFKPSIHLAPAQTIEQLLRLLRSLHHIPRCSRWCNPISIALYTTTTLIRALLLSHRPSLLFRVRRSLVFKRWPISGSRSPNCRRPFA